MTYYSLVSKFTYGPPQNCTAQGEGGEILPFWVRGGDPPLFGEGGGDPPLLGPKN